ncbi:MAG TPA: hypothetical protein VM820_18100 [Vicinamibacterales bacterium]|jgi:hypothetical protein|nr:hypothetical protein [Vicinamibacterales bacterium]
MRKFKLPMGMALCGLLAAALVFGRADLQAQGAPVLNPAVVLGPNVTFTWSTVPGASSYILRAGIASNVYLLNYNVGNTATYSAQAPALATYYVRVAAVVNGVPIESNEISFQVVSLSVPPTAPTDFATYLNGVAGVLTWNASSGNLSHYVLQAGTTPGGADVVSHPLPPTATSLVVPFVPPGTYYLRVVPFNGNSAGPASNEARLEMPAGGGCTAPPARVITPTVFGQYVRLSWPVVPGADLYQLNYTGTFSGASPIAGNVGSVTVPRVPLGVYAATLTTYFACGLATAGPAATITVDGAPPPGPRTPNPPAGERLPLPNRFNVVNAVAARFPNEFRHSCPTEHRGDTNRFLFELVRELRREDNRWGLNWKRGNRGDMSQDIITYNYGSESDEDTTQVYIVDTMFGHCGPSPSPGWIDQTAATRNAGAIGRWTLLPYLDAGYPLAGDLVPQ